MRAREHVLGDTGAWTALALSRDPLYTNAVQASVFLRIAH